MSPRESRPRRTFLLANTTPSKDCFVLSDLEGRSGSSTKHLATYGYNDQELLGKSVNLLLNPIHLCGKCTDSDAGGMANDAQAERWDGFSGRT
jgi:hypothetical protein